MNNIPSSPIKFIKKYLNQIWLPIGIILLLSTTSAILSQLGTWYLSKIVSLATSSVSSNMVWEQALSLLTKVTIILLSIALAEYLIVILLQFKCAGPLGTTIRRDGLLSALHQPQSFWNKQHAGEIYDKIEVLRRSVAAWSSLGNFILDFYKPLCIITTILALLAKIHTRLSLVFGISSLGVMIIFFFLSQNIKTPAATNTKHKAAVFGKIVNMISNFSLLKSFASLNHEKKRLQRDFTLLEKSQAKYNWIYNKNIFIKNILVLLLQVGMISYAVWLWMQKQILPGDIVYVLSSTTAFTQLLYGFCWNILYQQEQISRIKTALNMFSNDSHQKEKRVSSSKLKITSGKIEIKNLHFAYPNSSEVLKGINLTILPGEKIGIVGPSGGGKTTFLHLLQRIIDTPQSSIFIDNQDITKVSEESLHQAIGFIPQDTSLFHRTIKENISYGKLSAKEKEIHTAATLSYSEEFIQNLPDKYQTLVGDKGIKLSGGQRQRIGIARAILKSAPILLLDEATSALDSKSEYYIQKSLKKLIKNQTVIAVAHRLSTLKNMNRIIVIDKGKIIEDGTPEDLLKKDGKYAKLWNLQK